MDIEIVRTVEDDYRLWDGDTYLADCGKGVEGEERAKAIWDEIMNLQVANDELRGRLAALHAILTDPVNQLEQTKAGYYIYRFNLETMHQIADAIGLPKAEPEPFMVFYALSELPHLIRPD